MPLAFRLSAVLGAVALLVAAEARAASVPPNGDDDDGVAYDASRSRTIGVAGCAGRLVYLTPDEKATLDLHDAERRARGLPGFCVDAKLTVAARAHSDDMLAGSFFSHSSGDGTSFGARIMGVGYAAFRALAENIAWGSGSLGTAEHTFQSWMNSAGHRANIENARLREIGIGVSAGTFQRVPDVRVYTVDFGAH